jgi:DNA-binding phage protein
MQDSAGRAYTKPLNAGAHPRFETINSVLRALGVKFAVVAEHRN